MLEESLSEIPKLRTQTPERQQYALWFGRVCNVLDLAFGVTSIEYRNFARAVTVDYFVPTDEEKRKKYNAELDAYETALRSVIHKCELIEREQYSDQGTQIKKYFKGTPEEIAPHVFRIAESVQLQAIRYKAVYETYNSNQFSKQIRIMCGTEVDHLLTDIDAPSPDRHDIGLITLQSLPNDHTLFIARYDPSGFDSAGYYFNGFLDHLSSEFKNLCIQEGTAEKMTNDKKDSDMISDNPKAFIAHGGGAHRGKSGVLEKLCDFIEALGIEPIVVELSASRGMSVDDKVNKYIKDADCGIVLATKGGIVDTTGKNPKQHPRLNVIDELERLRAVFPERTILLLENGVDLPSNISGLTHERFARQSMDRAFIAIARELGGMKILKAVRPQE